MRVLLINKFHYHRDGAANVYLGTGCLLNERGHDTAFFAMEHPDNLPSRWSEYFVPAVDYNDRRLGFWQKLKMGSDLVWNREAQRRLQALIDEFRPDLAHLHVIYHQLSPAIIHTLKKNRIPIVMTHHDFKAISPLYNLFHQGQIREETGLLAYFDLIRHKRIKDSYFKSMLAVLEDSLHRLLGSYGLVDINVSPSRFLADKFREKGFKGKIEVIPNPYLGQKPEDLEIPIGEHILYFGRLSREKGIDTLLSAWSRLGPGRSRLLIAGTGPAEAELKEQAKELGIADRVDFLGYLPKQQMARILTEARAVVLPSLCYENFSLSIIEAMMAGRPVLASRLGGNSELVERSKTGFLFTPGDINDLCHNLEKLIKDPVTVKKLGVSARQKAILTFGSEEYIDKIINIYKGLLKKE